MRWSRLKKLVSSLFDPSLDLTVRCTRYRCVSIGVGRYWLTLNGEIIWDIPKDCTIPREKNPYSGVASSITIVLKQYLQSDRLDILTYRNELDHWGLSNILRAADRRIGRKTLEKLREQDLIPAAQRIIDERLRAYNRQD